MASCGGGSSPENKPSESKLASTNSNRQINHSEQSRKSVVVGAWMKLNLKKKTFIENKSVDYSFTFHSEDSARWNINSEDLLKEVTITEERTNKVILRKINFKTLEFIKKIDHTDVYTIKVSSPQKRYFNLIIERMPMTELSAKQSTDYLFDTIDSKKGTKNAIVVDEINFVKAVNEPRKIVLSSNISLSGESKIILPLELPKNSSQFLYELRISGENEESSSDGQLFSKLSTSVNEYKVLGKTLFEKSSSESSLTREILNTISLPKRERVSTNVYFFPDEKNARSFTDHNKKGFNYDTKNSLKNTESMNGIIKPQKDGFVYLGFESTSTWRDTYIWLDAVAIQIRKRYVLLKKIPKESTSY